LRYTKSHSRSKAAFINFTISPTLFVAETNEDGFRLKDVRSVCATGKSSKKASDLDKSIGEKGFGFKSVFSVAEKVHIQSGIWSFSFEHKKGEDGLGMVTPLDAPKETLSRDVTTRFTLHLANTESTDYQKLLNAIRDVPHTTILFLYKLRRMQFQLTESDARLTIITIKKLGQRSDDSIRFIRTQESGDNLQSEESAYRYVSHVVGYLPQDESRNDTTSKVELAFPVHPTTHQPQLSDLGQHVFAYLPICRLQHMQVS
jgi:hypothetical protein